MTKKARTPFYEDLGFRLRQARMLRNITQTDLAEGLNVSMQTVQRYESGEVAIPTETLVKCSDILNAPLQELCKGDALSSNNDTAYKNSLLIASEIMALPSQDLRKNVYQFIRTVNHIVRSENQSPKDVDEAA